MTTITHDAWEAARKKAGIGRQNAEDFREALGITIAPPEPPEGMVKLAREICNTVAFKEPYPSQCEGMELAALAALQHAVQVVRDVLPPAYARTEEILRKLGADA